MVRWLAKQVAGGKSAMQAGVPGTARDRSATDQKKAHGLVAAGHGADDQQTM